jgi:hypothetical protein
VGPVAQGQRIELTNPINHTDQRQTHGVDNARNGDERGVANPCQVRTNVMSATQSELRALPTVAGPQPEDVALAGASDADRDVNGSVGDLPVADGDEDASASDWGYQSLRLRCEGKDVDCWPSATGWTS